MGRTVGTKQEIKRIEKWREPFSDTVDSLYREPFKWGENDCAIGLVRKLIIATTGKDLAKEYEGTYLDAKTGFRVMKKAGFDNLADLVASILPEIHLSQAKIGDIAAIATDDGFGYALGVVNGERVIVLTEKGIGSVDIFNAARFFKVG